MAVEKDQSAWLPEPPPPRPARRDAAIDAALRRFDGLEEPAPTARERRRSWARTRRPQLAMAFSALLLVVVGIPAALIGLRNQPSTSESKSPAIVAYDEPAPPAPRAPSKGEEAAQPPPSIPRPVLSQPVRKFSGQDQGALAQNEPEAKVARNAVPVSADELAAAPPPPAPPPPSPAAPAQVASGERAAQPGAEIVVTGARVAQPALTAPQGFDAKTADQARSEAAGSVNPAFAAFLSRLQGAVRSNDKGAVVALIGFPLRLNARGGAKIYRDAPSVQRDFDRIFTARVRRAILAQRANRLFVRDQGAMIGNGEVWFDHTCPNAACSPHGPVAIKAVNP